MSVNLILSLDSLKPPLTGIGYYTLHLARELLRQPDAINLQGVDGNMLLDTAAVHAIVATLCVADRNGEQLTSPTNGVPQKFRDCVRRLPGLAYQLRKHQLTRQGRKLAAMTGHLLHATNGIAPPFKGPSVITVHDLSHIRCPETHPPERVRWLDTELPRSLQQASQIIAVSEFTRRELLNTGLVNDPDKIRVCYNGCEPGFQPRAGADIADTLARWGLQEGRYMLSVATLEPRKNLKSVLQAYMNLPAELAASTPLVLAGTSGWGDQSWLAEFSDPPAPYRIIFTGYLPRATLQHLLSGAGLFAYLSLYEGFGLPVVEAMASSVPVLTSNEGALAEVVGDSGYTVAPKDVAAISTAMADILSNTALSRQYQSLGMKRAQDFTWQSCARDTVQAYQQALAR
jgi:glycosyltransferase involved in cell wall biosynthesis